MLNNSAQRAYAAIVLVLLLLCDGEPSRADEDATLARAVPADLGLYAEVRGCSDLLLRLTDPLIWSTLAELAGQPAQAADVADWRKRIRQTIKMAPEEAIKKLFSEDVAFIGEGLGLAQDAVVLCRPSKDASTAELLTQWEAQALPGVGNKDAYQLFSNIGVSSRDGLLCFGDLSPPEGLFKEVRNFLAGDRAASLAKDEAFQRLMQRVPSLPDGVFFVRMNKAARLPLPPVGVAGQPDSQPSEKKSLQALPASWSDAQNVLLTLHRKDEILKFTAVADLNDARITKRRPVDFIKKIPSDSLLAWQGRVDFDSAAASFMETLVQNPIQGVFQLEQQVDSFKQFVDSLDTGVCFTVGAVSPAGRDSGMPPFPALAVMVEVEKPEIAIGEIKNVVNAGVAAYSLYAYARGMPLLQPIGVEQIGSAELNTLDLSPLLKPQARSVIGEIHLCWALHEGNLIFASHKDWFRRIIEAREGRAGVSDDFSRLLGAGDETASVNSFIIQSGDIAEVVEDWLVYLQKNKPEVFNEDWWRERQPGGGKVRLGVDVTADDVARRLCVTEVRPDQPAFGRLKRGDYIVGYGDRYSDRRFQPGDMIAQITEAINQRPQARWFILLIERDGVTMRVRLPIPFIAPVQALNRMAAIGRLAQRAVYRDDVKSKDGPCGYLSIELRKSPGPVRPLQPLSSETTPPSE